MRGGGSREPARPGPSPRTRPAGAAIVRQGLPLWSAALGSDYPELPALLIKRWAGEEMRRELSIGVGV